ncbi:hypothetical protein [Stigmatella aurantiaca]|uniref:Uncharacterized protein n=1 Tax=Stigmatella aurantiaca (strain DW4/3-1) TaxID=378806 RepID=Q08TE6_STIAD|nr:hypothetical protein [Stigmatella aurantiaca]ADO69985.1 uncharacterized protein STAUR_2181 [Stigmatella aurantiaca DW4/3-1]EAU63769.1 conserved hypothetical protein [Stigmatella aurantiaca DW4/3-1]
MTKLLLIGLASLNITTAELQETASCTATVTGPTFGFSGRMYFHFTTTCDAVVDSITIDATVAGPSQASGTTTCTRADTCSFMLPVTYKRGTWTWTNDSTYTADGASVGTKTMTFVQ